MAVYDITGTEFYIKQAQRGLTLGGWFRPTSLDDSGLISKYGAAGNRAYALTLQPGNAVFYVSSDGTAIVQQAHPAVVNIWQFIVGRFIPSVEVSVFVNDSKATNGLGIPNAIFISTADFEVGRYASNPALVYDGRMSLCFICAAALSDAIIWNLYQQSRALFGV